MTFSGYTNVIRTSRQNSPRNSGIDMIILHHAASTDANGVVNLMVSGARQVSSNYVVGRDGTLYGVVPEELRAWTSGSASDGGKGASYDRRSITFEVADESYGGSWPISAASYETLAKTIADLHNRYGIPLDRNHIVGHRELWTRFRASYATACPGGMDIDKVVNMARAKLGQGSVPASGGAVTPSNPSSGSNLTSRPTAQIQAKIGATADGIYGPDTTNKLKAWQAAHGLAADGIYGPKTDAAMFGGATPTPAAPASNNVAVDGAWGPATTRKLQAALGVNQDGALGPITYRALQRKVGATADGIYGPATRKALQRHLGVPADGIVGPQTVRALQTRLNAGSF
jgi:peptidoglycan hydrolase-like protein with peptidoglycan-binding domain